MIIKKQLATSLIGSLSREVIQIRARSIYLLNSMLSTRDNIVFIRLKSELNYLDIRRTEILRIAMSIIEESLIETLSIEFLVEIANRPIKSQLVY